MTKLTTLDIIALILIIIGGLDWLLIGVFDIDLIGTIFEAVPVIAQIIYIVIGLAALYLAFMFQKFTRTQ